MQRRHENQGLNGKQVGAQTVQIFEAWATSASYADFRELTRRGILNRTAIAKELGFGPAAFSQNEGLAKALLHLENRLRADSVLPPLAVNQNDSDEPRLVKREPGGQRAAMDAIRLQRLEQENALLRAENAELKTAFTKYEFLREALSTTGRLPR